MSYEEFRDQWMKQHPASVPVKGQAMPRYPRWLKWAVGAMFMCAALVSGVHTIPTVRSGIEINEIVTPTVRDAVSVLSFVAVEFAILISAYLRGMNRWLSTGVLLVALSIAMISNITSVERALANTDTGTQIVALIMGVGAPLMALLAGAGFLIIDTDTRSDATAQNEQYQRALVELDAKINAAWVKTQKEGADSQTQTPAALSAVSVRSDTDSLQTRPASYGYSTTADGKQTVIHWLNEHPDDARLGSRPLGKLIGVSHDTANKGRQEWQRQQALAAPSNGNGHREVQP